MTEETHTLSEKRAVFLALLVILAYVPAWPGSFLWDDDSALILNPHTHEADGLKRIWFSTEAIEYYPINLHMIYPRRPIEAWNPLMLLPLVLLLITLVTLWRYRDKVPLLWIGGLFYVLALLPVSGLFDNTFFTYSFVANHWWYPAMFGLIPLVTTGLDRVLYARSDPSSPSRLTGEQEQSRTGWHPVPRNRHRLPALHAQTLIPIFCVVLLWCLTALEARRFHDPIHFYTRGNAESARCRGMKQSGDGPLSCRPNGGGHRCI